MRALWDIAVGPPLPTQRLESERLNKIRALAAFSPDALSSIAYANQEIFLGLVVAGAVGLMYSWPIALAIAALLGVLALSYSQTLWAYPTGGGSYTVAKENLGAPLGLVAAGALLIDYVLTAAVSLTAGVAAIASAFPGLWSYRVELALVLLVLITLANLRGLRESGTLIAVPVYLFVGTFLAMLLWGGFVALRDGPGTWAATLPAAAPLSTYLILHTFAAGCTALTGIEAISNGITAFREPVSRNANQTLWVMALLMASLFLGSIALTQYLAVLPQGEETILSALARRILDGTPFYYIVQASTLLVLAVAANTSFAGFPRVASVLAQDRYLPHQFSHLGDRLVYSNGMLLLAGLTAVLILVFAGDSHALIPLFAVGVFLAFTLSQAGMVVHWIRVRGDHWPLKALANGVGALVTTVTFFVVAISKFAEGAWVVLVLIPAMAAMFYAVRRHYREVSRELTLRGLPPSLRPLPDPRVVLPISGVHRGVIEALRYAQTLSKNVTAVYVETQPGAGEEVRKEWELWAHGVPLDVVPSPYRSVIGPLLEYLDRTDTEHNDGQLATVILPEFVPAKWWQVLLHNQTAWLLKLALLYRRRRGTRARPVIDIPYYLRE
ncbi:MAG TPA: APC family permease [Anaerolineales bacterium]|nr:APC family permease [Anaerolineales bacterium]